MSWAHAPARGDLAHSARNLHIDLIAVEALVDIVGGAGGAGPGARQEPPRQRTEGRDGDPLVPAGNIRSSSR